MSNRRTRLLTVLLVLSPVCAIAEPLKYSGSLMDAGQPAEGTYALRLTLFDTARGGRRVGKELTLVDVPVSKGRFNAELDFGLPPLLLEKFWMQVEVAGPEGVFEALGKRESLDAKALAASACWSAGGNAGTTVGTNYVGTSDDEALDLRANGLRALRIQPSTSTFYGSAPSIAGGADFNSAATPGGTVAGGGATRDGNVLCPECGNVAANAFSTVSGGWRNRAIGDYAVVGGGEGNVAKRFGVVAGGDGNDAGEYGAILGGQGNDAGRHGSVLGGGFNCVGGEFSVAAGYFAKVRGPSGGSLCLTGSGGTAPDANGDEGSFVWADTSGSSYSTTGPNQFLVRASGGVGVNTTAPKSELHVVAASTIPLNAIPDSSSVITAERSNGNAFITILGSAGTQRGLLFAEPGNPADGAITYDVSAANAMQFRTNGNVTRMTIGANGNLTLNHDLVVLGDASKPGGGSWTNFSDARLKRNIVPLSGALDRLLSLRGVRFEYAKPDAMRPAGVHDGFVAQEVQQTFPHWVNTGADGYLTVGPKGFEPLTVEALRELAQENAILQAENAQLRTSHEAVVERLERIEALLAQSMR